MGAKAVLRSEHGAGASGTRSNIFRNGRVTNRAVLSYGLGCRTSRTAAPSPSRAAYSASIPRPAVPRSAWSTQGSSPSPVPRPWSCRGGFASTSCHRRGFGRPCRPWAGTPTAGLPASAVARAYVASLEGEMTGEVLNAGEYVL
jgi:hypothetical protein